MASATVTRERHAPAESAAVASDGYAPRAPTRPRLVELGVGLVVFGCPLAFLPMSSAPFVDIKIAVLLVATLLIWLGRPSLDRRLSMLAAVWVGVMALAGLVGVDRWMSLAGPDGLASGLILFGPCAYLLVVGASLSEDLAERVPTWLFLVSVPVAAFALVWRFVPGAALDLAWRFVPGSMNALSFEGATLGHPVLLSGLAAAGAVAATAVGRRAQRWSAAGVVLLVSALSVSTKRAGLVALALGLLVVWLRAPESRRRVAVVAAIGAATLAGWLVGSSLLASDAPVSGVGRFGELATDSSRARVVIAEVLARSSMERPLLGWGPGNTWSAYLSEATPDEVEVAQRGILDAHNIVVGALVTTGLAGLAAFVALGVFVVVRARRAASSRAFAAGVAAALLVYHLMQPVSAPLTPLLCLLAGIAAGPVLGARKLTPMLARLGRATLGVGLVVLLGLSLAILGSSVLERWGRSYNSVWALRAAVAIAPGRFEPVQWLVYYRAEDATVGDPSAAAEVRELVDDTLRRHPLFPNSRYLGVDAGLLLNDHEYARRWLRRQLEAFPADRAILPERTIEFAEGGPAPGLLGFAQAHQADAENEGG